MNHVTLALAQDDQYDEAIAESVPDMGDLTIITKDVGMESGRAAALLTFTVTLPGGKRQRVQYAIAVRHLHATLAALRGRYNDDGFVRPEAAARDLPKGLAN